MMIDRRDFLRKCLWAGALGAAAAPCPLSAGLLDYFTGETSVKTVKKNSAPEKLWKWSVEARHYTPVQGKRVICRLCPNRCLIPSNGRSRCDVRVNKDGKLYSLVYGNPSAIHIDPVEKKPLYHFHPSSSVFSMGTAGCNFNCLNCQNWELSQKRPEELNTHSLFPSEAAAAAKRKECASIAYTYNEPTVAYEFMMDTAKRAKKAGLNNIYISNGFISPKPLTALAEVLDAANIDLKAFSEKTYRTLNSGQLQPVLEALTLLRKKGVWVEITCLLVPNYTDDIREIRKMCVWVRKNLGPDVPLHFSRFHPQYKLKNLPSTPPSLLLKAREIAMREKLNYVYIGNLRTREGSNTYCPGCGKAVVKRIGYRGVSFDIEKGKCRFCGTLIAGYWGK